MTSECFQHIVLLCHSAFTGKVELKSSVTGSPFTCEPSNKTSTEITHICPSVSTVPEGHSVDSFFFSIPCLVLESFWSCFLYLCQTFQMFPIVAFLGKGIGGNYRKNPRLSKESPRLQGAFTTKCFISRTPIEGNASTSHCNDLRRTIRHSSLVSKTLRESGAAVAYVLL